MQFRILLFSLLFSTLLLASGCKDNPSGNDEEEIFEINSWIHQNMELYYFWNERVPEEPNVTISTTVFFNSMLEPTDEFSYYSDDAQTLLQELNGSSFTAGFSPYFGRFSNSNNVFIVVEFSYPNSPAKEAGIERGDLIIKINGQVINTTNYLDLYYDESPTTTYTLAEYDSSQNTLVETETIELTKGELNLDPVVYSDIIEKNGTKIGYVLYARFLTGENDQFIESVDNVISDFKSAGVNELVIDLRYNPGGRITAATNFANALAPPSVTSNEEVFVRYEYNENLENYYIQNEGLDSPNLVARFSDDPNNLNLDRVYFLTTSSSASASELLINGLTPYMDVISIGTPTFGKFYGSYVLTGENANPPNNYAVVPVTLKYSNAAGFSDFRDGLAPDHAIEENILELKAVGDTTDVMLAKAIQLIAGGEEPPAKLSAPLFIKKLDDPIRLKRGNIFFE
ncbi:MAG: S41 family peptidase [Gracilimonas sp.]|uniref:S41 family peptidase n=1 Tax=Gracilimonas sp. TaxID=1974203 RepID=UPI0037523999|nr:S41 family peptidase [Gracilimonas sp.]